jgi:hypothetical protein
VSSPPPLLPLAERSVHEETPKLYYDVGEMEEEEDDDDDDDDSNNEDVKGLDRKHCGEIASPYLTPYPHNRRYLIKYLESEEGDDGNS